MPWKESSKIMLRTEFVESVLSGRLTKSQACRVYEISRPTGDKWIVKALNGESLEDRSRAPFRTANRIPKSVEGLLVSYRKMYPALGAVKIHRITVLNAAILLNGERPVSVRLRKIPEHKIVFESADMDVHGEFETIEPLQSVGDPFDSFVLQKAALLACGVIPAQGGSLEDVLERLGGGIWMDTEVTGVPKGSGLGTSSILAAACVKALLTFLDIPYTEETLYSTVLCMEQIMSTGGGWQDQVGGVTDGIKYITSRPGLHQIIRVQHIELDENTKNELNDRFTLIYTGQRRLARNLLRDVVGRYIGNEPDTIYALNEIQRTAVLMRFELERGNVDAFAELLSEHWKLSQLIDAGSTNTLIDQIFDSCDDLLAGKMICGAGGGGFLQVVLKKGVSKEQLQVRLKSVFSDTAIGVWDAALV